MENIQINNPEGEESLILITLLLVDEINKLKTICSNSFLEGNLISKFLSSLYKRDDIKQFIHQWVSELIIKLEYSKDDSRALFVFEFIKDAKNVADNIQFFNDIQKKEIVIS